MDNAVDVALRQFVEATTRHDFELASRWAKLVFSLGLVTVPPDDEAR